jgi:hypothetical protein
LYTNFIAQLLYEELSFSLMPLDDNFGFPFLGFYGLAHPLNSGSVKFSAKGKRAIMAKGY